MNRWTWMWLATAVTMSGCGARWVSATEDAVVMNEDASTRPDAPFRMDVAAAVRDAGACLAPGARCRGVAAGCCVGFCNYLAYGYGPGVCVTPQPEGSYCEDDRQCLSGQCADELCRTASCAETNARCESDEECCGGFCTASSTSYAPGRCAVAQPAGASCDGPRWCSSGRCVDSVCAR